MLYMLLLSVMLHRHETSALFSFSVSVVFFFSLLSETIFSEPYMIRDFGGDCGPITATATATAACVILLLTLATIIITLS